MILKRTRYDDNTNEELYSENDILEVVKEIIENIKKDDIFVKKDDKNDENLKKNIKFKHTSSISFNIFSASSLTIIYCNFFSSW